MSERPAVRCLLSASSAAPLATGRWRL